MKPLKEKVSITLDNDIVEKIKLLAEEDERSFSQYINKILKEYLKNQEQQK
ncbi:MAG: ribbon-helix-helix protein, CopG family [Clostridia bacterium]|nr:ribbon-helix-helix protein, CopG family [Clostridia bacterium]MBR6620413.1 ribbon-helix-helix protein, CopG family [Clostridia bacterium]